MFSVGTMKRALAHNRIHIDLTKTRKKVKSVNGKLCCFTLLPYKTSDECRLCASEWCVSARDNAGHTSLFKVLSHQNAT